MINVVRMRKTESPHQGGGCFRQELLMNAKAGEWRLVDVQDIGQFGISCYKIFISHKDKCGDSRVEKPGRQQFDQVIKVWHPLGLVRVTLGTSPWNAL